MNIREIEKKFDELKVKDYVVDESGPIVEMHLDKLKAFIRTQTTSLLQSLIDRLEGEKLPEPADRKWDTHTETVMNITHNNTLSKSQEIIKEYLK